MHGICQSYRGCTPPIGHLVMGEKTVPIYSGPINQFKDLANYIFMRGFAASTTWQVNATAPPTNPHTIHYRMRARRCNAPWRAICPNLTLFYRGNVRNQVEGVSGGADPAAQSMLQHYATLAEQHGRLVAEKDELASANENLHKDLIAAEQTVDSLKAELLGKDAALENKTKEVEAETAIRVALEGAAARKDAEREELESHLKDAQDETLQLREANNGLTARAQQAERTAAVTAEEVRELHAKLAQQRAVTDALHSEANRKDAALQKVRHELEQRNVELRADVDRLRSENEALEDNLERERRDNGAVNAELQVQLDRLTRENAALKQKLEVEQRDNATLTEKLQVALAAAASPAIKSQPEVKEPCPVEVRAAPATNAEYHSAMPGLEERCPAMTSPAKGVAASSHALRSAVERRRPTLVRQSNPTRALRWSRSGSLPTLAMEALVRWMEFVVAHGGITTAGRGAFGDVLKVPVSDSLVAIKLHAKPGGESVKRYLPLLVDEVDALRRCQGPGVVRLVGMVTCAPGFVFGVAMEPMACSLADLLIARTVLPPSIVRLLSTCMVEGLTTVHAKNIIHADIKPANILVDSCTRPTRAVICDLGLAAVDPPALVKLGGRGTAGFRSPEQDFNLLCCTRTDVWAAGLCMACMVGYPMPQLESDDDINDGRREDVLRYLNRQRGATKDLLFIVAACLHPDPELRPGASDLLHMMQYVWEVEGAIDFILSACESVLNTIQPLPGTTKYRKPSPANKIPLTWVYALEAVRNFERNNVPSSPSALMLPGDVRTLVARCCTSGMGAALTP